MNEEEREKICARRAGAKRLGSVETEGGESPHVRGQPTQRRPLYRKTLSVGDTIAEADDLWKSHDSRGSNESLASNASIPLPIPVRLDQCFLKSGLQTIFGLWEFLIRAAKKKYTFLSQITIKSKNC
jgi:hypothetical protein